MKTLDTKRPYGTVCGCTMGRRFEQDGVHFNSDGTEWVEPAEVVDGPEDDERPVKPVAKKGKAKPAPKPAAPLQAKTADAAQVDEQLKG